MRRNIARWLMPIVGGAGGYAYYYFIGCTSGTCPLSSNAWIMTIYGTALGGTASPLLAGLKEILKRRT